MAMLSMDEFKSYLPKNGEIADEEVFARSQVKLQEEILELNVVAEQITPKNVRYVINASNPNQPTPITSITVPGIDTKPFQISLNGIVLNPERYTFNAGAIKFVDTYVFHGDILTITK